jgi:hypothetical protein
MSVKSKKMLSRSKLIIGETIGRTDENDRSAFRNYWLGILGA